MFQRSGRSGNVPAVSFFAFQDIVTGVAGVMLILMLALAGELWLAAHDRERAPASTGGDPAAARRAMLAAEEARLRAEVHRLEEALRTSGARRVRETRLAALRRVTDDFRARSRELRKKLAALPAEPAAAPPAPPEREYRTLLAENRRLEAQYRELRFRPAIPPEHRGRKVIVLECRERDLVLTLPGAPARSLAGSAVPPLPAARRELFDRLRPLAAQKHFLAVLVRPGAGGYVTMLLNALEEAFPELDVAAEPLFENAFKNIYDGSQYLENKFIGKVTEK